MGLRGEELNYLKREPKELIEASWLDEYNVSIDAIWWQLIPFNSSILILQEIIGFPFDVLFSPPDTQHFWNLVTRALFDSCVLTLWRIGVDKSDKGLSLRFLKNQIMANLKNEDIVRAIGKAFNEGGYEVDLSGMEGKIEHLRHNYLAHFNRLKNTHPTNEDIKERTLLFKELQSFRRSVNSYFEFLCFGHHRMLYPIEYNPTTIWPKDTDTRLDVQKILEQVGISSPLINMPELNPAIWEIYRENLSENERRVMNEFRQKAGLGSI